MNTLTKLALGLMGHLKPFPPVGDAVPLRPLLPPSLSPWRTPQPPGLP